MLGSTNALLFNFTQYLPNEVPTVHTLNLDSKGNKQSWSNQMYDLCLDRRNMSRRGVATLSIQNKFEFERRRNDRRTDNRPLNEFPYLP